VLGGFPRCFSTTEYTVEWYVSIEPGHQVSPPIPVIALGVTKKQNQKNEHSKPNTHRHLQMQSVSTIAVAMGIHYTSASAFLQIGQGNHVRYTTPPSPRVLVEIARLLHPVETIPVESLLLGIE
jgi:hypothetical protein